MLLLGSVGEAIWGFWAKAGLVNSNQKSGVWGKPHRGLVQGVHKGRLLIARATREAVSGTHICLRLCKLLSGTCACIRGCCQFKVPADRLAKQQMSRQLYHGAA